MSEVTPASLPTNDSLKLVILDQSKDARDAARDQADERLSEELTEGGRVKRFVNGIWKGNVAKEFYRQRYTQEALGHIEESQNVLTHETGLSIESRGRAINATIERFQTEHDEVIHVDAGEKREILDADSEIATTFKSLIRRYAQGDLNDTTLREERTRFMQAYRENHNEAAFGEGLVTTDNMTEIARAVMGAVEHGESLDHVIANMQVVTGEARSGVRTEARYNKVDAVIDKLSKSKVGSIVGPEIVVSAVTLAATAAKWGSQSVLSATLKTIAPGAGAGVWAGLRENKRMKDERSQHSREMAQGKEFSSDADRRNEIEATRYESVSAQYLTDSVREFSEAERLDEGDEALKAALDALAQVQSRIDLSNKRNIDLISYSDAAAVGDERMALDVARAEARVALEHRLTPEVRDALGLESDVSVRDLVNQRSLDYIELIDEDLSAKDRAFKILKAKRVAKAAAIGVATGLVGGVIAQEFIAAADPTRAGLFEKAWGAKNEISADGLQHQTLLEGFAEGGDRVLHTDASDIYRAYPTAADSELGSLSLSNDHTMVENGDGTISLVDPNGHATVEGLAINPDGSLPQESLDRLDAAGMAVEDHSFDKEITTTTSVEVNGDQFVQNHLAETTQVKRDFWYGNDTPGVYDQNELRVFWGGQGGIVDGGYQLSAAGMTAGGSWQGGESVDWNQASANGNLFMSISATVDTQTQTFMVPIGPDGAINIPADSPAGHFFTNVDGHAKFTGAYAEVVQTAGVDENGVVHMRPLATLVGSGGDGPITDTVVTTTTEHHAEYIITTEGYDTTVQNFTEAAPVLPIASRRSMEAALRTSENETRGGYYYGRGYNEREREQVRSELSPRLSNDPNVQLNVGEELNWFRGEVRRVKGDAYVQEIETFVDNDPSMQRISGTTESIVTIPVGAAFEADNIYGTLSLYAQQDAEGLAKTAVLLNVNWLDTAAADENKMALIQKTISEIERAKVDFPDLIISYMLKEYSQQQAEETGGVIGYVVEDLVNASLLAVQRKIETGAIESSHDVVLVRGDADAKGLSRTLLRNFQRTLAENKDLDVLKGAIRYGAEESRRFPGYGIVSSLMTSFQILATQDNVIHTGGINFGVRASTLAAVGGLGEMLVENEAGSLVRWTGAGSDDVAIGRRIALARRVERNNSQQYNSVYSNRQSSAQRTGSIKRVKLVAGAVTDTSADRLLPMYLNGDSPHNVWNPGLATGYAAGPGGYRDRLADADVTADAQREDFNKMDVYKGIENAMSLELSWASEASGRKALAIYFASVPGAYRVTGRFGDGSVRFELTDKGREFIKNRVERETNGRFGSYGMRKMRQLYGVTNQGSKRQPASNLPPLVSPLS